MGKPMTTEEATALLDPLGCSQYGQEAAMGDGRGPWVVVAVCGAYSDTSWVPVAVAEDLPSALAWLAAHPIPKRRRYTANNFDGEGYELWHCERAADPTEGVLADRETCDHCGRELPVAQMHADDHGWLCVPCWHGYQHLYRTNPGYRAADPEEGAHEG